MYKPAEKEVFHVHTYRCKHASDEDDEAYVRAAVDLGAKRIVFTDHAPFPGNPFGHRMQYEELSEYISSLLILKDKYAAIIEIMVGLEIEYFPSFEEYYSELKENLDIEVLMLGQHMFEVSPGCYSFQYKELWFPEIAESVIRGIKTDIFDGVAHPDRVFKKETIWTDEMQHLSEIIVQEAGRRAMFLEQNESSKKEPYHYWPQFWKVAERMRNDFSSELLIINGLDAHSTKEIML